MGAYRRGMSDDRLRSEIQTLGLLGSGSAAAAGADRSGDGSAGALRYVPASRQVRSFPNMKLAPTGLMVRLS